MWRKQQSPHKGRLLGAFQVLHRQDEVGQAGVAFEVAGDAVDTEKGVLEVAGAELLHCAWLAAET